MPPRGSKKKTKKKVAKKKKVTKKKRRPTRKTVSPATTFKKRLEILAEDYIYPTHIDAFKEDLMALLQSVCEELDNTKAELKREKAKKGTTIKASSVTLGFDRGERESLDIARIFFGRLLQVEVRPLQETMPVFAASGPTYVKSGPERVEVAVTSEMTYEAFRALEHFFPLKGAR